MSDKKENPGNKKDEGASRNLSNRMYGKEEGDDTPATAKGKEAANTPEHDGANEGATRKTGISYEPDSDVSGAQGAYGQGNAISLGTDGAQGYGKTDETGNEDMNYDGQFEDKKSEE